MDVNKIVEISSRLIQPLNRQILMTDDREELIVLACLMMNKAKDILDENLGVEQRRNLYKEFSQ